MKRKTGIFLMLILEAIIFYLLKRYFNDIFLVDRFLIISTISVFCCCHLIFDIRKMYDFIYKKRYLIGIIFLIIITVLGYHGSSISAWNNMIQPNYDIDNGGLLIGIARLIRGDEYIVSTPMIISQASNNFSNVSNILMGHKSLVTMYPSLPCFNISLFANIFNIAYLILPINNAFAFCWYGKLLLIFFASFELCMLITKKNRLYSLLGAILIAFSPVCSWWSLMPILGYGAIAIVILNLFLKEQEILKKIIYTIIFSVIGISYIMLLYPAWQVPFSYVYLCFVIWSLYENKENLNKKQFIYLVLAILLIFTVVYMIFKESYDIYLITSSTAYPGKRFTFGGYGYERLFNYMINIFFPCIPFYNPCEFSNFIGMYPIPFVMSCKYIIKNKKKDLLSMLLIIVIIFLSLWNCIKFPEWLIKYSLLSFSVPERTYIVIGYASIFLIIRNMSLYEKRDNTKKRKVIYLFISVLLSIGISILLNNNFKNFLNIYMSIVMNIIFVPIFYMLLLNTNKTNKILSIYLIILSLFVGGTINPISKGTNVITEKPFAKEIQKIVSYDNDAKWITVTDDYMISNYMIANGASTINSTNYYPNLELWGKFDENKKYENIYNRYAHILIELTNDNSRFELITQDMFKLYLNVMDINKLDIDYIVSNYDISNFSSEKIMFENIYADDGIYIYKISLEE